MTFSLEQFGSLCWVQKNGGVMSEKDNLLELASAVRALAARKLRVRNTRQIDLFQREDIIFPDTAIAKAALQLCKVSSPRYLLNHCIRSYYWARFLVPQKDFDDEAVFVAMMLHDLGLTEEFQSARNAETCFTWIGANEALRLGAEHGWTEKRCSLTADAITLHLNVSVAEKHGIEAQMVRLGSGADVAGLRQEEISSRYRTEVVDEFPRLNQNELLSKTLIKEANNCPNCRIGLLVTNLGLIDRILANEFFNE